MRRESDTLHLLMLETTSKPREYVAIARLLHEASEQVSDEARLRSLAITVVAVDDEVFVNRHYVKIVLVAMLRSAIERTHRNGRIVITAQEIERDLAFAVYASGPAQSHWSETDELARIHARALGGRFWRGDPSDGRLALFTLPLYMDEN
ncbi:MAG: hypothetical protein HOV81_28920 [Kofleriaceae bacterium]|nr:hypothetical protein [Kofleriaceae bacterium]